MERRLLAAVVTALLLGGAYVSHQATLPASGGDTGRLEAAGVGPPLLPFATASTASPTPTTPPSTTQPPADRSAATRSTDGAAPMTAAPVPPPTTAAPTTPATDPVPKGPAREGPVRQAEIVRLDIPGVLSAPFGGTVRPDPTTNLLEPTTTGAVYRWADRGLPGTTAADTVYLLGHTVRAGGGVFDRLQGVRVGQHIRLTTRAGTLDYTVTATRLYPRDRIQHADEVYASVPGRLVLVGCYLNSDGTRQDRNFVVFAQLTG